MEDERIKELKKELEDSLKNVKTNNDLVTLKAKYLGKTGIVTELTKNMKDLSQEEKVSVGKYASAARNLCNELFDKKNNEIL